VTLSDSSRGQGTLRDTLLLLSKNRFVENTVKRFEMVKNAAANFVSGDEIEDAIRATEEANKLGIMATIDQLGESVTREERATRSTDVYVNVLERIAETGADANVSIKLTQLGLDIDYDMCLRNVESIVERAAELNNFVRMDMEDSPYTQRTLDIFKTLRKRHQNVGIVLQAYLYRTEKDVEDIVENGYSVRLCKGAYTESKEIAFPKKSQVDNNFILLLEKLLSEKARKNGAYVGVATHDEKLIGWTKNYAHHNGLGKNEFEFQMLFGIRKDLQEKLAREGYRTRAYIPFGTYWYSYYMRRLAERPSNMFTFARTVLGD
jgi:proline dehydrogenase